MCFYALFWNLENLENGNFYQEINVKNLENLENGQLRPKKNLENGTFQPGKTWKNLENDPRKSVATLGSI